MRRESSAELAALAALCLALSGCARKAPAPPPVAYPYPISVERPFFAGLDGLQEGPPPEAGSTLASKAPNASVLSADASSIAVAVNGWGLDRVLASPDGGSYRLAAEPLKEGFSGLATSGAWPAAGGFLVQLYRDPFSDAEDSTGAAPAAPASGDEGSARPARLAFFGGDGTSEMREMRFPPGIGPDFELFALLPSGSSWFAELRKDAEERVDSKYLELGDPLASTSALREIPRAEFEEALKPRPLSELGDMEGKELRAALSSLGPGPWLARLRSDQGADLWYISSGKPEEAALAFAWVEEGARNAKAVEPGTAAPRLLALSADGALVLAEGEGPPSVKRLHAPVEGADFTALAAAGDLAAAAWEAGDFPEISSAGVVVSPLP
jgi:hypothetical protein